MMNLPFKIDLQDKVAVITGGSGVICSRLAEAVGLCGSKVALLDLNLDSANKMAAGSAKGIVARGYECNVINKESIEKAHQAVLNDFGPCDILINGAGGNNPKATTDIEFHELETNYENTKTFFDLDEAGFRFVFDLNFLGTLLPTQVFAKDMMNRPGCNILNISSMNAFSPLTKIPAYSSAKASINNFTQWLAVYFSHVGIRVNAIAPGFFVTNQNRNLLLNPDGTPTPRTEKILRNTPMGRFGEVDELIGSTLFLLCNEASSFITGTVIPIDGGFSCYSGV